ncbi:MAG: ABC transporter permease [Chlorobi bacterium]|nr:ABC transporter permease [Chlorobiota bacterium]
MNFPLYIAKRYLLSKKSHNIINIISGISVVGVTVGTMALIVVLSVFNGFEDLVKSLFNTFDADILITAKTGKTFNANDLPKEKIKEIPGLISYTEVVEENALLKYKTEQYIVKIKGVSEDFLINNPLDTMLVDGAFVLQKGKTNYTIMGYLVAYHLGINLNDFSTPVNIYVPRRTAKNLSSFESSFNTGTAVPSAVFSVQQDIDTKYIIIPLGLARKLMEYKEELTGLELRLSPDVDTEKIIGQIKKMIGGDYVVKNRFQQQELLYKIMKSEKWAIFFILSFILLIATFNVVGSLTMLILDKKKDIAILYGMGANNKTIKRIFLVEGILISISGAVLGLLLGAILCWLQLRFGLIGLGSEANAFIVPAYPVKMVALDFIAVFFTVFLIGLAAAWYPVRQISKKYLETSLAEFSRVQ